jgi:uncharacterized surface protein with fasciclin (FAS1) repeats
MNGHDRSPVKEKRMNTTTESEKNASAPEVPQPKTKRTKKAKPAKKAGPAKNQAKKPKADRANKKAEVIAMMKRAKGATLAEIMAATKWQAHTVRGFVSILGSKGGEKVESSKNAAGERAYKIAK